jgi:hypothetical protein
LLNRNCTPHRCESHRTFRDPAAQTRIAELGLAPLLDPEQNPPGIPSSGYWRPQPNLPDAEAIMRVHSTHYVSHRGKHHHIADSAGGLHFRQNERLGFDTPRIPDNWNDRGSDNSLGLNLMPASVESRADSNRFWSYPQSGLATAPWEIVAGSSR